MKKNELIVNGQLTGTIGENQDLKKKKAKVTNEQLQAEFGTEFDAIQQTFRVNPVDEADYNGTIGYKDS